MSEYVVYCQRVVRLASGGTVLGGLTRWLMVWSTRKEALVAAGPGNEEVQYTWGERRDATPLDEVAAVAWVVLLADAYLDFNIGVAEANRETTKSSAQ